LSDFNIRLDAEKGQVLNWCFTEYYNNATESILNKEEALKITSEFIHVPADAVMEEFFQETEENSHITNITWRHLVNGLEVESDSICVQINSKTKQVISLTKIWNDVPEQIDRININDALRIAEEEAPRYTKKAEYDIDVLEQKYIPIVLKNSDDKPFMKIVKVWQVNIREPAPQFPPTTTLSIDCEKGEIVRVEYSK